MKKTIRHNLLFLKNNNGFTFIETIIYVAIIGTVVASFVTFSISISNSRNKTYVVQEVQANARMAMNLISQKIRLANGINIASSTWDADPGVLSLSMSSSTLNPTIINLSADDGILQIKQGNGATVPIVSDKVQITNLVFTNLTASSTRGNVKIQITTQYNNASGDVHFSYSQTLQSAASLRQ
jgi:type II secretory pathway pseudopilin PulG